jgi:hypothetical protein
MINLENENAKMPPIELIEDFARELFQTDHAGVFARTKEIIKSDLVVTFANVTGEVIKQEPESTTASILSVITAGIFIGVMAEREHAKRRDNA